MACAGSCTQNNTCGGGAFPELMGFQCKGFNPEGQGLGTAGRCASNAYDNMGYLTLDFTCATSDCKVDGDCQVVSMHEPSTSSNAHKAEADPYTLMEYAFSYLQRHGDVLDSVSDSHDGRASCEKAVTTFFGLANKGSTHLLKEAVLAHSASE